MRVDRNGVKEIAESQYDAGRGVSAVQFRDGAGARLWVDEYRGVFGNTVGT